MAEIREERLRVRASCGDRGPGAEYVTEKPRTSRGSQGDAENVTAA
jgi:hypothetical protein